MEQEELKSQPEKNENDGIEKNGMWPDSCLTCSENLNKKGKYCKCGITGKSHPQTYNCYGNP